MKYPHWLKWPSCVAVATAAFFGCSDTLFDDSDYQIDKVTANPEIALPIATGNLKIGDLLSDTSIIRVYDDGLVYLVFDDTQSLTDIRTMVRLPDRSFASDLIIPAGTYGNTPGGTVSTITITQDLAFNPERLSEIKFKAGTDLQLDLSFSPDGAANDVFEVEVFLPGFEKDGQPLTQRVDASGRVTISLEDYVASLNSNQFEMTLTILEKDGASPQLLTQTTATIHASFLGMDFKTIKGFLGDRIAGEPTESSIEFSGIEESLNGAIISFAEPKITFSIENEFGLPVSMLFDPAQVRDGSNLIPIQFSSNPAIIEGAPTLGETANSSLSVLNAGQIFNAIPDELFYGLTLRANEGLTDGENFMTDTSKLTVNVHAELPLYGKADNIIVNDTTDVDLSDAEESEIESATIGAKVTNELPVEAKLQVFFLDAQGVIFDSLFNELTTIIPASSVTEEGELLEPGVADLSIEVNEKKLEQLFKAKKVIIEARGNTSKESNGTQNHVQFKADYTMNIALKLRAKVKLETEL